MPIKFFAAAVIGIVWSGTGAAQAVIRDVMPNETQAEIAVVHGPHRVSAPDAKNRKNKLVISLSGTGGRATAFDRFDEVANTMGYHTVSLDYKNEVITVICLRSKDSACYDYFRKEIVFGTPVSDKVQVDSANSIYNRVYRLLQFLTVRYPAEGWDHFFHNNAIVWSAITVAGHSQGAGHAAYLGKHFKLDNVIILAGPQDFLEVFDRSAPWIHGPTATAPDRYWALLHPRDPFGFGRQFASCLVLSATKATDSVAADEEHLRHSKANILITHNNDANPHGSVIGPDQAFVWRYFLSRP